MTEKINMGIRIGIHEEEKHTQALLCGKGDIVCICIRSFVSQMGGQYWDLELDDNFEHK